MKAVYFAWFTSIVVIAVMLSTIVSAQQYTYVRSGSTDQNPSTINVKINVKFSSASYWNPNNLGVKYGLSGFWPSNDVDPSPLPITIPAEEGRQYDIKVYKKSWFSWGTSSIGDVRIKIQDGTIIKMSHSSKADCTIDNTLDTVNININEASNSQSAGSNSRSSATGYTYQNVNSRAGNAVCDVLDSKKIGCTVDNKKFRINKFNGNIRKKTANGWTKLNGKATVGKSYLSAKLSGKTFTINRQTAQIV